MREPREAVRHVWRVAAVPLRPPRTPHPQAQPAAAEPARACGPAPLGGGVGGPGRSWRGPPAQARPSRAASRKPALRTGPRSPAGPEGQSQGTKP